MAATPRHVVFGTGAIGLAAFDSTKIAAKLDVHATPLDQALADTLANLLHTTPAS